VRTRQFIDQTRHAEAANAVVGATRRVRERRAINDLPIPVGPVMRTFRCRSIIEIAHGTHQARIEIAGDSSVQIFQTRRLRQRRHPQTLR